MTAPPAAGLTPAEVAQRVGDGRANDVPSRATRSVADIVRANVFTRINAILAVLFAIVLATGSLINGLFGLLIIVNSVVGMVQELRAKQTLDKLSIVGQAKPLVRRSDGTRELPPKEVVSDDIIELGPGDQVVARYAPAPVTTKLPDITMSSMCFRTGSASPVSSDSSTSNPASSMTVPSTTT